MHANACRKAGSLLRRLPPDTAQGLRQGALLQLASSSRTADSLGHVGDIREDTNGCSNIFNPYRGRVIIYRGIA